MAWIAKNSATMQIDRRDEPYLTDQLKAKLDDQVLPRYPTRQAATLPVLHAMQQEHNWLPHQAIEEAADYLKLSAAQVLDTATFYEESWLEPTGKYLIMVCQSLTCELMGHDNILKKITDKLAIEPGQTTQDGKFTLMTTECLGSCGTAPCALLNETLHENLTAQNVENILDSLE